MSGIQSRRTFRQLLEGRGYAILKRFVMLMKDGGRDAALEGQPLLSDQNKTAMGALFNAAGTLYLRLYRDRDPGAEEILSAVHTFLSWQAEMPCETWGKRWIMICLCQFQDAGLLGLFSEEELSIAERKTDIADFFDKQALRLRSMPNNYMELALWLLEARKKLGWETKELCASVRALWNESLSTGTDSGYMDDNPPNGRFDSYTFMPILSIPARAEYAGKPVSGRDRAMLRESALWYLSMANGKGDGFCYGRSLSVYGDYEPVSVLRCALTAGVLTKEEEALAYAYLYAIYEKFFDFWYDDDRRSFNIWWDGRGTDGYRESHRALEVNIEFALNFISIMEELEARGLADTCPETPLPMPDTWQMYPFVFRETPYRAEALVLRRGELLMMLPLVGIGNLCEYAQYLPFPASCRYTEVAPQCEMPIWVPEYHMADGETLRPIQFYTDITHRAENGEIEVCAEGYLAAVRYHYHTPEKTEYRFRTVYRIRDDRITVTFETDAPAEEAVLCCPENTYGTVSLAEGFDTAAPAVCGRYDVRAPHGRITAVTEYRAAHPKGPLSQTILLPESAFGFR